MQPYQLQGLNWMMSLHHDGLSSILADEMVCFYFYFSVAVFFLSRFSRRCRPFHSSPISSITNLVPVHTSLSFLRLPCKTKPVNLRHRPRPSASLFSLAPRKNVLTSSRLCLILRTSRSPSHRTKSASLKRARSRNSLVKASSST